MKVGRLPNLFAQHRGAEGSCVGELSRPSAWMGKAAGRTGTEGLPDLKSRPAIAGMILSNFVDPSKLLNRQEHSRPLIH